MQDVLLSFSVLLSGNKILLRNSRSVKNEVTGKVMGQKRTLHTCLPFYFASSVAAKLINITDAFSSYS